MKAVKLKMCTLMVSYKIKHYHRLNEKTINTYTKRYFFVEGRKQGNEYVMFFCLYYMYEKKTHLYTKIALKNQQEKQ